MVTKAGMDLTEFESVEAFEELLDKYGMEEMGAKNKFMFVGDGVTLITGNHPITGEYRDSFRENEPAYASYIGIQGTKTDELFADICKVATTDGMRVKGEMGFIR